MLAFIFDEPGADAVEAVLYGAVLSVVNLAEVVDEHVRRDRSADEVPGELEALGVRIEPLTTRDALVQASWRSHERRRRSGLSLSLADRCCLAVAQRLRARALTADAYWSSLTGPVDVVQIR